MDKFTTIADVENFYNRISLEMIKNQKNKLDNGRTWNKQSDLRRWKISWDLIFCYSDCLIIVLENVYR